MQIPKALVAKRRFNCGRKIQSSLRDEEEFRDASPGLESPGYFKQPIRGSF